MGPTTSTATLITFFFRSPGGCDLGRYEVDFSVIVEYRRVKHVLCLTKLGIIESFS